MRIHLILRSMWPKRAHLEDVHVGVVELIGLGDEACPVIPRIKGLLCGVAMEMRVSCCLCSTHTPDLPRLRFGADLRRRKRSVDQIPYCVNTRLLGWRGAAQGALYALAVRPQALKRAPGRPQAAVAPNLWEACCSPRRRASVHRRFHVAVQARTASSTSSIC